MASNIAHRGAGSLAPENSLAAIRKAWEIGADRVEIDVSVSFDEHLFLLHDQYLLRTTNVSDCFPTRAMDFHTTFTLAELKTLDAGSWFVSTDPFGQIAAGNISEKDQRDYKGLKIPSLEEVLRFVKEKDWMVNIELKKLPPPLEKFPVEQAVLQLIKDLQLDPGQIVISSFYHNYLYSVKNTHPEFEVQALIGDTGEKSLDWGKFDFTTYNANADLIDEAQIATARANNSLVNIFTVNDTAEMRRFINAGVKGIITDFPQNLANLLHKK